MNNEGALSGIRVIDFGAGIIEPLMTAYLADFGAEVIKVESYSKLDFIRAGELFVGNERNPDRNLGFNRYNQNKQGVLINLKLPKGVALAKRLVSIADVVTESFTVGVIQQLGLGYEELRKVKPDLIMFSSSFAGQTGPYRDFRGQGSVIATLGGVDDITGWPDRAPLSHGSAVADFYLPWLWASIVIAALEYHRQTGRGQFIDASSLEGVVDILDSAIADYSANKRALTRRGNRHPAAAPHGIFRCKGEDRWLAISVFTDEEWRSFCQVAGNPDWIGDKRFATLLGRLENVDELERLVEEQTTSQKAEKLMFDLQKAGVAAGGVENARDPYEDPQLTHREHFWQSHEPDMEVFTFESPSGKLSATPAVFRSRAPFLGEHNDRVFLELLHLEPDEYGQLVAEGVIG